MGINIGLPTRLGKSQTSTGFTTSCPNVIKNWYCESPTCLICDDDCFKFQAKQFFFISHVIHVNMFIVLKTWPFVLTFSSFHAVSDSPWDIKIHNPSNFSPPCIVLGTCRSWYSSSKDGAPAVSHVSWGRTEKNLNSRVVVSLLTVNWYHCD